MRILHLTADWKWTGPAEPMVNAIVGLRARDHAVDAAFPPPPEPNAGSLLERARRQGLEPVIPLARRRGYLPLRDTGEVWRLRALFDRRRYDVVHAHHTRDLILARRALRRAPPHLVASWHHGDPIPARIWNRWLLGPRGADGLVVLGSRVAAAARRELAWPDERVAVVPGSVDVERFAPRPAPEALRRELGLTGAERVIGLVARLQPHRRVDLLLEAFQRAQRRAPQLRLLVVGRGTRARELLEQPVVERGLGSVVLRAGYRREDYRDVLSLCDALVYLVPGSDGSCRAVLEAMALEIPVIASARGILPEIVRDGETGRIVPEVAGALAEEFIDLWREPARWRALGKAARRRVLERHTIEFAAERLERFYSQLLAG